MRASSSVARLAIGLVSAAAAVVTGFVFHNLPYGSERESWLTAHGFTGTVAGLLAGWIVWRGGATAWRSGARAWPIALVILVLLFVTGYLSVTAWDDGDQLMRIAGVLFLPGMGMVSSAVGDTAEQFHKLLMQVLLWLIIGAAAWAAWRRWGKRR